MMKATGIVRRIDNLGRVVIPKELRKSLGIAIGCPMEIFTDNNGELVFKKAVINRGDKLRQNNNLLATQLAKNMSCGLCSFSSNSCLGAEDCLKGILAWLNQPVFEDDK